LTVVVSPFKLTRTGSPGPIMIDKKGIHVPTYPPFYHCATVPAFFIFSITRIRGQNKGAGENFCPDRLDISKSTTNLGIDSLMAADIVAGIRFHFEVEYAIMDLLKGPSIVELANDILEKMDLN
jgi:acyl carrier protein